MGVLTSEGVAALGVVAQRYGLHTASVGPVPMRAVLAAEGWRVLEDDDMLPFLAVAMVDRGVKLCFINAQLPAEVQRFALAHELVHQVLGHRGLMTCRDGSLEACVWRREEIEANEGAAWLLVPPRLMGERINEVAARCGVPAALVHLRLSSA